jgi:hypothetical protein
MQRRVLSPIAWLLLSSLISMTSGAAEFPQPLDADRLMPTLLVKVTRLSGVAPDGSRLALLEDPDGVAVPLDDFSPLTTRLTAVNRVSPVAFHTLWAELAPGVFVLDRSGQLVQLTQTAQVPKTIPLAGAVLQLDNTFKMLGVRADRAVPAESPRERYAPRYRESEHDD